LIISFIAVLLSFEVKISNKEVFEITDEEYKDKIIATYYPGSLPFGVMVLQGFSSDQISIKSIATEFNFLGFHVLTYDYSGHGRSSGFVDFNNTATDKLASQLQQVKSEFKSISGLEDSQIALVGQSYGARIALQEQTFDSSAVAGLVLIGVQVNLDIENMADVFTGVSDLNLEWIINLGPNDPLTNITIITGAWDDVLPPKGAILLYEKLINDSYTEIGGFFRGVNNLSRELLIFDRVVHNYEVYSPEIINTAILRVGDFFGLELEVTGTRSVTRLRNMSWLMIMIGFYTSFIVLRNLKNNKTKNKIESEDNKDNFDFKIEKTRRYLLGKLITFALSIPIMVLIFLFIFIFGTDLPLFTVSYTSFLFGLGTIELLFFWKGKMIGVKGEWRIDKIFKKPLNQDLKNLGISLSIFVLIIIIISFTVQTGLWFIFPIRKIPWLVVLTPFSSLGFYISIKQLKLISRNKEKLFLNLLGFFGILIGFTFLVAILSLVFGFIGIIIGFLELLIILGFISLFGVLLSQISNYDFLTALLLAFLLQWIIIPESVIFGNPLY
jgi:hypothetical protein